MCVCCFLYLSGSSPHAVFLEGAWTISWISCWGQLRTHSSFACRTQNRDVLWSRRRQSYRGKSNVQLSDAEHCDERTDSEVTFPPISLFPVPWWQTLQQPPLGRVSVAGRSNGLAGRLVRFKLLSWGNRDKEQNSSSKYPLKMFLFPHKTTLSYDSSLSHVYERLSTWWGCK